jgi:hypothetical protein
MKQASCESTSSSVQSGQEDLLNESDMSVVGLPPTPLKPEELKPGSKGVSSQILPLHRLSSESTLPRSIGANRNSGGGGSAVGGTSLSIPPVPPAYKEPPKPKPVAMTGSDVVPPALQKPVAEVSPFSSAEVCLAHKFFFYHYRIQI